MTHAAGTPFHFTMRHLLPLLGFFLGIALYAPFARAQQPTPAATPAPAPAPASTNSAAATPAPTPTAPAPTGGPAPELRLYIVYPQPGPGLHLYDKPGYIAAKPDLIFTTLLSAKPTKQKNANGKLGPDGKVIITSTWDEPVIDLGLTPDESAGFLKLTTKAKGKHTLLMLNDTPLTAPMVDGPIDTPIIRLEYGKMKDPDRVTAQIETMLKK